VTICVTNRALPYSMSNDILRIVLCRGLVRRVVSLPKESLRRRVTDFFKTFKIVDFRRDFLSLAKFRCASWSGSGDHIVVLFSKHSCSVHFCLMNLMMISQTAQCWSTDGLSKRFEVGEREFDFWHQKMSV